MKSAEEKETFEKMREKECTRYETLELTWAVKELSEALGARSAWDTLRSARNALRYMTEFIGKMVPTPELTESEAEMSQALHTYMRKGMDCPLGTMLYRCISENKGTPIWYAFCKEIVACEKELTTKNKKLSEANALGVYHRAIHAAEKVYDNGNSTTEDLFMVSTLRMWEEDFPSAIGWITQ